VRKTHRNRDSKREGEPGRNKENISPQVLLLQKEIQALFNLLLQLCHTRNN
jgi:hypothetical protein